MEFETIRLYWMDIFHPGLFWAYSTACDTVLRELVASTRSSSVYIARQAHPVSVNVGPVGDCPGCRAAAACEMLGYALLLCWRWVAFSSSFREDQKIHVSDVTSPVIAKGGLQCLEPLSIASGDWPRLANSKPPPQLALGCKDSLG